MATDLMTRPAEWPPLPGGPGWPEHLIASEEGPVMFDGCGLLELAHERGTPLWVLSRASIEGNYDRLHRAFTGRYPNSEIAYSIKANNTMAVIRLLYLKGAKMDCSAEYEFLLALASGVPPHDLILNGNGKSDFALRTAAQLGVRQVNVDSLDEAVRLNRFARESGTTVSCTVRIQLTYDELLAKYPTYEPTLRSIDKAGSSIRSGAAMRTVEAILEASNLDFCGLHHHKVFAAYIPSDQNELAYSPEGELEQHRLCTAEICEFANEIHRQHGVTIARLDLGGSFRTKGSILLNIPGTQEMSYFVVPSAADYANTIFGTIEQTFDAGPPPLVQFEAGGHQVQGAGILLTSVSEIKDLENVRSDFERRRVATVDASRMMFANVERGLSYPAVSLGAISKKIEADWPVEIVGQSCMPDPLAADIRLPSLAAGDVLAIFDQGAYTDALSTQMNGIPRPEVVLLDRGTVSVVKRRETIVDIQARHLIPAMLWQPVLPSSPIGVPLSEEQPSSSV